MSLIEKPEAATKGKRKSEEIPQDISFSAVPSLAKRWSRATLRLPKEPGNLLQLK